MSVYQVSWLPGSDHLLGRCHCGAQLVASDPIDMWVWLLGHPDGHRPAVAAPAAADPVRAAQTVGAPR